MQTMMICLATARAHLDSASPAAMELPLPARDERGEGWGEGLVCGEPGLLTAPLPDPLPTPSSWREGSEAASEGRRGLGSLPVSPGPPCCGLESPRSGK